MGKYIQKCKVLGEIAVMEVSPVGARTRARTLALDRAEKRKRARLLTPSPEKPSSPSNHAVIPSGRLPSPERLQVSRCSSNGSSELVNRQPRSEDLEGFENAADSGCRERRESTPSSHLPSESDELESTASPRAGNSRRKPTAVKMPSEEEIEEFFVSAEKDEKKRFAEKYNFDVAKEVPLEGRYQWLVSEGSSGVCTLYGEGSCANASRKEWLNKREFRQHSFLSVCVLSQHLFLFLR